MTAFSGWLYWIPPAGVFITGVILFASAFRHKGWKDRDGEKYAGLMLMYLAVIFGLVLYGESEKPTEDEAEISIMMAEADKRSELVCEKLNLDESDVILSPNENGLFNAITEKGNYLVEFDENYEEIEKIIKLQEQGVQGGE